MTAPAEPDPWSAALADELGLPAPEAAPAPAVQDEADPARRIPPPVRTAEEAATDAPAEPASTGAPTRRRGERRVGRGTARQPDGRRTARQPGGRGATRRRDARAAAIPSTIHLPPELPITERADELVEAIRTHQVVVVAGETGSGKSTQLPKLCLQAGRGVEGMIGHTQPRRIAARAVAERVAEELGGQVGGVVGYQVRFTDAVADRTAVKLMTDGILLNELQRDRDLSAYDTIIIDEAHERGLNIDFILGYLKQLLPRRPDLHVVVTSATIDTERFAAHFAGRDGTPAPVFEVSGRTYPVELRYRPLDGGGGDDGGDEDAAGRDRDGRDRDGRDEERDLVDGIVDAVREVAAEGPGDVLVFASGERDIRDAAEAIRKARLPDTEVLPLYARLSAAEQHRVFQPHRGRRVVIATNIAETSLTVPGIRYVVDPGLARISRYGRRTKVQRLPIEKISRASADQRSGRCGRLGPGIAIRLYDQADLEARPEFTEPEIQRTNLASVILQMTALGLGDVAAFPFVDRPDDRLVADGVALLEELGATTPDPDAPGGRALTDVGRQLARIPLDPRLGRMVLAAVEERCLPEVMVIAAALSIQDVREHPRDTPHTAEQLHARFTHAGSDFITLLNLWAYLAETRRELSGNAFRKRCKAEFLHHLRIREWQDVYSQIRRVVKALGVDVPSAPDLDDVDPDAVHRAVLSGLLGSIGLRDGDGREYLGPRGTRFVLARRSAAADHPPGWVVAAELVETARLFASTAAGINPRWIEPLAGDLVKRTHSDPRWDRRRGSATTVERVTLHGLPIVAGRRIALSRVDRAAARQLFLQHALVDGEWDEDPAFQRANARAVEEVHRLEDRLRRRSHVDPADVLLDVYEARVPADIVSTGHFRTWWRQRSATDPGYLDVTAAELLGDDGLPDAAEAFPDRWTSGGHDLPLSYTFDPSRPEADGVTVDVPVERLPAVEAGSFDWLVPGLRRDLVIALIRALPKPLRRGLVPAPETADRVLARISPEDGPLLPVLARELTRVGGTPVPVEAWRGAQVPDHLRIRYRVVEGDRVLATGGDLSALRAGVAAHVRKAVAEAAPLPRRTGLTAWPGGDLPRTVTATRNGFEVVSYPALVDEGTTVGVRTFPTAAEQQAAMAAGTRRLLRLGLPNPVRTVNDALDRATKLALTRAPHADVPAVVEDCLATVIDAIVEDRGGPAWTQADFEALRADVRSRSSRLVVLTARAVARIVSEADAVKDRLRQPGPAATQAARADVARQLGRLVYPGFVQATGGGQLGHLPRYLQAMRVRVDAAGRNPERDAEHTAVVADLEEELRLLRDLRPAHRAALAELRWQVEELRVSLFAQQLGAAGRVSEARIREALARIRATPA